MRITESIDILAVNIYTDYGFNPEPYPEIPLIVLIDQLKKWLKTDRKTSIRFYYAAILQKLLFGFKEFEGHRGGETHPSDPQTTENT